MLKHFSSLALLALGTTVSSIALGSSAAIANPDPLPNLDNIIFAETVEKFTQGESTNWNGMSDTIGEQDRKHKRWINGGDNLNAVLGENNWTSDMVHKTNKVANRYEDGRTKGWDKTVGLSLGKGGALTVGFGEHAFKGNGQTSSDVWIFEIGKRVEKTWVEVGDDQDNWYKLGIANRSDRKYDSGVGIDIDVLFDENHALYQEGLAHDTLFSFVRVTDFYDENAEDPDAGHRGFKSGADIDAIAALSFVVKSEQEVDVPEPGLLLGFGVMGAGFLFRRKSDKSAE